MISKEDKKIIEINSDDDLNKFIEGAWIKDHHLYIKLKLPQENMVIITIKNQYTSFRNELEKRLKEKEIPKDILKRILRLIDNNNEYIFPDDLSFTREDSFKSEEISCSDHSDHSDPIKIPISVSECIKLHEGAVKVTGNIVGISEPVKTITSITSCECTVPEYRTNICEPPLMNLPNDCNKKCSSCGVKPSFRYENAITIIIQDGEKFNDLERLTCILIGNGICDIRMGERVTITGQVHVGPKNDRKKLIPRVFARQFEYEDKQKVILSDIDIEAIKKLADLKGPNVIETLIHMYDASLIGNDIAKKSLLLALVSTGDDLVSIKKRRVRNRINVLLTGDPGLGKTSLLKKAVELVSNSRYESVQHSTAKSLTAVIIKEEEQPMLKVGSIPNSRGSICALNEISSMMPEDQNLLLDIMEEGEFTLNKQGIHSKISSPTAIIASTNLTDKNNYDFRYKTNPNLDSSYSIPLERHVLDRFDIIVVLRDMGDPQSIKEYARRKTDLQSNYIPSYDEFIRKYIEYARQLTSELTPESIKMIQKYYFDLCQLDPNLKSKRRLDTIIRICKAVSKLRLKKIVDTEDVTYAFTFYNSMIHILRGLEVAIPKNPIEMTIEKCLKILKFNKHAPIVIVDLFYQICVENEYLCSYLLGPCKEIDKSKLAIDKNKKTRRIWEKLQTCPNVTVVNKSPIKIQFNGYYEDQEFLTDLESKWSEWSDKQIPDRNTSHASNIPKKPAESTANYS